MGRIVLVAPSKTATHTTEGADVFLPMVSDTAHHLPFVTEPPDETLRMIARSDAHYQPFADDHDDYSARERRRDVLDRIASNYSYPVRWGVVAPDLVVREVVIDPLVPHVMWDRDLDEFSALEYIRRNALGLSKQGLRDRFWNYRTEMEEWASAHTNGDIFVQPTKIGWLFLPINDYDGITLRHWLQEPKRHVVSLPGDESRHTEIINWIGENVSGEWKDTTPVNKMEWGKVLGPISFLVRERSDAVHLRLRWASKATDEG